VLSVWTVLNGAKALDLRNQLIAAAEAGDFSEFSSETGVRVSIVIQGADQASPDNETGSPLAKLLAGENVDDDARAYELVLPKVEHVLTHVDEYEALWREPWQRIAKAIESFERNDSTVREFKEEKVSLVTLAPAIFSNAGFNPTRHAAPYTAVSRYARGQIFLITTPLAGGWTYRIDYPYYSWAETVVRPRIRRRDLTPLIGQLNELETNRDGKWKLDASEMTSAAKFVGPDGALAASTLDPETVTNWLCRAMVVPSTAAAG
jgi:hypothetical protein